MNEYRLNKAEVKRVASGLWLQIIPAIDSRFSAAAAGAANHYPCPVHGGVDGFRFLPDAAATGAGACNTCCSAYHGRAVFRDGLELLQWSLGLSFFEVLGRVNSYLSGESMPDRVTHGDVQHVQPAAPAADTSGRAAAIRSQWMQASSAPHGAALEYYKLRGIGGAGALHSPSIRYHTGLPYYVNGKPLLDRTGSWITWPAIIGAMRSRAGVVGLLRIYLAREGRKATEEIQDAAAGVIGTDAAMKLGCKTMLTAGAVAGGAVRLGAAGDTLAVCEGLETGLAVALMRNDLSVAACGTGALLMSVDVPDSVSRVLIYADKDRSGAGAHSAESLQNRLLNERQGVQVEIFLPQGAVPAGKKGIDWLDEYGCAITRHKI